MDPLPSINKSRPLPWRTRFTAAFAIAAAIAIFVWLALRLTGAGAPGSPRMDPDPENTSNTTAWVIDAAPWGRVQRVLGPGGSELLIPEDPVTPIVLELFPGKYRVEIAGPPNTDPRSCEVEIVAHQAPPRCRVSFVDLEPVDYFREAGWWN